MKTANANFYAALLWPEIARRLPDEQLAENSLDEFLSTCRQVLDEQRLRIGIGQHIQIRVMKIWDMQWRLERYFETSGARALRVISNSVFGVAMKFLALREQCEWSEMQCSHWWRQYHRRQHDKIPAPSGRRRRRAARHPGGRGRHR